MTRKDPSIPPTPDQDDYVSRDKALPPLDTDEPLALFADWFAEAKRTEPNDPNAMCLATVDEGGLPDARMVLLKDYDADGFVFYTNLDSAKGQQLAANAQAALVFHWKSLRKQVRMRGSVQPVTKQEADAYFSTRARDSQIGAWASTQSRPLDGRFALEKRIAEYGLKHAVGTVPRPPHWSGFRLQPVQIEFWRDRAFRLHDRLQFTRPSPDQPWEKRKLFP